MTFSQTLVDTLAEKAIVNNDASAHQALVDLGYEFQHEFGYWDLGVERRIGWYWGQGLLPGKSKGFYYRPSKR